MSEMSDAIVAWADGEPYRAAQDEKEAVQVVRERIGQVEPISRFQQEQPQARYLTTEGAILRATDKQRGTS